MLFGKNLQRSYKYIMYATKTPSLRIDQSDLKCKSGCGFYGNAQWHGYCSKCNREQQQRQRLAEQSLSVESSDRRSPQEHAQKNHGLSSSFSKFEEKKLRQSDSLKKNKLLKLNVFRKTSFKETETEEKVSQLRYTPAQFSISQSSLDAQKKDFFQNFPHLNPNIERDIRKVTHTLYVRTMKQFHTKTIDELSENVQNGYQAFMKRMQTNAHYADVDSDVKEQLLDFVEKHVQTYLHNILFSPTGTGDEKADARLHSRIRQLSWVSPQHLDCQIDQKNEKVRDLLYEAITELVSMDSVAYPGGKLACLVGCCRRVVALVGARGAGPASADDLLPALILAVLQANPPRLTSNLNFVTRFCNAARLMSGEAGYYFTNLCCAVSFIENLTAESLSMSEKEFNCCMKMPTTIGGGSWVAALSLCEGMHEYRGQMKAIDDLNDRIATINKEAREVAEQSEIFSNELSKKVEDILGRTPLDFSNCQVIKYNNITKEFYSVSYGKIDPDVAVHNTFNSLDNIGDNEFNDDLNAIVDFNETVPTDLTANAILFENVNTSEIMQPMKVHPENTTIRVIKEEAPTVSTQPIESSDMMLPSFSSFDAQSVDELITPDEYNMEQFMQGLTNVNYDFDLSDLSGDNSVADDAPADKADASDANSISKSLLDEENRPVEEKPSVTGGEFSILDKSDSPTAECLLPSPIKPVNPSDNQF